LAREITCLPPVGPGGRRFKAKLKADADIEIERLKSSLQIEAAEHQVRFAKLHKKRGEIIAELYALLVEAHSVADEGVLGDADKTREAFDKILKLCLANCNFASQRACHNVTSPRRMLFISKALVILAKHSRKHPCNNALRSLYLVDFKFGQSFSGATIPSVSFRRNSSEFRERQYSSRVSQRRLQLVRGSALLLRLP